MMGSQKIDPNIVHDAKKARKPKREKREPSKKQQKQKPKNSNDRTNSEA